MNLTITPAKLRGAITPPPSKSQAHRLIICAALAAGESVVENIALSQDVEATLRCMEGLGARWTLDGSTLRIAGIGGSTPPCSGRGELPRFDCGESGSTLRFLIPIALAAVGGGVFTGQGRLMERPQQPYFDLFTEKAIFYEQRDGALTVRGTLKPGTYRLPGNVSSQFFTGLLLALPLLSGSSRIVSTTKLESVGYVNMTCRAMENFGVTTASKRRVGLRRTPHGAWEIPGGQAYQPRTVSVEADWSQAAFWYAAQALGCDVEATGMNVDSLQLDKRIVDYRDMIQGKPLTGGVTVPIWKVVEDEDPPPVQRQGPAGDTPHATCIDVSHCPDLVPPLAAMGACMNGTLYINKAGRLRLKESDRLAAVTAALTAMGAKVIEEPDRLIIQGQDSLRGGCTVDCCNDHRIAMMAAVAATRCREPVTLLGAECVKKSYPNFWEDYKRLGGIIHEHTGE